MVYTLVKNQGSEKLREEVKRSLSACMAARICFSQIPSTSLAEEQGKAETGWSKLKKRSLHDSSTLLQEDRGRLWSNP